MSQSADPSTVDRLLPFVRESFGWHEEIVVSPGPRGALGQIWRLDVGGSRYALKEIFRRPPSDALTAAELAFARQAADSGVRLPKSHPDRHGRHVLDGPGGVWLRLYDWVDLEPVDTSKAGTPAELGALFAGLHRSAAPVSTEPDGGPPDSWYDTVPVEWPHVPATAAPWAPRLNELLAMVPDLAAVVTLTDRSATVTCHRDLHPENVLTDAANGELVVVDWDNMGPAEPARELARALFDWYCDRRTTDRAAVLAMYEAYVREGGPGRITGLEDFSMLVCGRMNFLRRQVTVALDPDVEPRHREWAEREIEESLDITPTPEQLTDVLRLVR